MTPRTRRDRRAIRICYLLSILLPLAAWLAAPDAKATPAQDIAYLATLDHFNVPYGDPTTAISAGRSVCNALDAGVTLQTVFNTSVRAGFTPTQAAHEIGAAVGAYCDEYEDLFQPSQGQVV